MRSSSGNASVAFSGIDEGVAIHGVEVAPTKLLLTLPEASHVLAISRSKLYDLLNSGHLPSVHIGRSRRVRVEDLENFVKNGGFRY